MMIPRVDWLISIVWIVAGTLALVLMNDYHALVIGTVACTALVGIGLNVLMGLAGQTSLGHAAFYSIGAYCATIVTMRLGMSFPLAILFAACISGLAGALLSLPALRVKGPYLAMVTIAFGYFVEQGIADRKDLTGGWNGIMNIPQPILFGHVLTATELSWLVVVLTGMLVPVFAWFTSSRWGIVMRATKDAEVAASALGANLRVVRVVAFAISAALTGIAGAFFAFLNGFISPESFPFFQSITFLLMVMIGGIGQAAGPLAGAVAVIFLPEMLSSLAEYRLLFFGGLLLLVLLIAPNGIVGALKKFYARIVLPNNAFANAPSSDALTSDALTSDTPINDAPITSKPITEISIDSTSGLTTAHAWFKRDSIKDLIVENLGIRFGGNQALSDVSLRVEGGKITSLIGPNGAGKTTLLNLLTGFYAPTQGTFKLGDTRLTGLPSYQIGRHEVSRTFQTSQLFNQMSVLENVYFGLLKGKLEGRNLTKVPRDVCKQLLTFVGFQGDVDDLAGNLAHVDRRLVEIARALAMQPAILLLDEPAAGLSSDEKSQLAEVLKRISASGVSVFLIEHDMTLVMGVSDYIHVLDGGRLIASGVPAEIQIDPKVKVAYLGEGGEKFNALIAALPKRDSVYQQDILAVGKLNANYGAANVLTDIAFSVARTETASVLGANGAGKSTLMRVIAGLHKGFTGGIAFDGQDISDLSAHEIAALGLVMVPEGRQVFTELSVEDNIVIGAHARGGLTAERLEMLYVMFPKLKLIRTRKAGLLSGGEQQMLALARGLAAQPKMMLLDEPSLGLAPAIVEDLFIRLASLREEGMTLVLVDQMAEMAMALSDQTHLLTAGEFVFSGTPAALKDSGLLDRAYLG